jgi:hypothetical protein
MTYLYAFTRNVDGQDIYFANDVNELQIAIEEISENRVNFNEREMEVLTNMGVNTLTTVGDRDRHTDERRRCRWSAQ